MSSSNTPVLLHPAGALVACALALAFATPAHAESPAEEALQALDVGPADKDVVQNRFFLKEGRFEVAPVLGVVPNNPMVSRYVGGVLLGYHFSESFSAGAQLLMSPDRGVNDLKDLSITLVQIAHNGANGLDFQQPLDKMLLGATFSANWAPVYGKINLVGATVLNFDIYGSGGLGLLTLRHYYAQYDESLVDSGETPVTLNQAKNDVTVALNLGLGTDIFLTQTVALKLDARSYLYLGDKPDYNPDPDVASDTGLRLYNNFIASAGVSMYFPKMQPRITDF